MTQIVHVVNQFFAGLGGEEKADTPVGVREGAIGAAAGLQAAIGDRGKIDATIFCGDNYFQAHAEAAMEAVVQEIRSRGPLIVIAGPAFGSGRYGLMCAEICQTVSDALAIPCLTAMHPDNPGVDIYREYHNPGVFLLPTPETAAGMQETLASLARFMCRLLASGEIGPALEEGYLPRNIRRLEKTSTPGAERATEMLLRTLADEPPMSEVPIENWDRVEPAAPLTDLAHANIAVVTTSGVVPWGNPDGFRTYRNTYWRKYNIAELEALEPGRWEAVHGGYNTSFMNKNPHYGVPLDALRNLEAERAIGKLYPAYYVLPGNQGAPSVMKRIGQEIADDLRSQGVDGVLLVST